MEGHSGTLSSPSTWTRPLHPLGVPDSPSPDTTVLRTARSPNTNPTTPGQPTPREASSVLQSHPAPAPLCPPPMLPLPSTLTGPSVQSGPPGTLTPVSRGPDPSIPRDHNPRVRGPTLRTIVCRRRHARVRGIPTSSGNTDPSLLGASSSPPSVRHIDPAEKGRFDHSERRQHDRWSPGWTDPRTKDLWSVYLSVHNFSEGLWWFGSGSPVLLLRGLRVSLVP